MWIDGIFNGIFYIKDKIKCNGNQKRMELNIEYKIETNKMETITKTKMQMQWQHWNYVCMYIIIN